MPEKQISLEKQRAVTEWAELNREKRISGFWLKWHSGDLGAVSYMIKGEPLVMRANDSAGDFRYDLYCSRGHARMLEKAGIIEFRSKTSRCANTLVSI